MSNSAGDCHFLSRIVTFLPPAPVITLSQNQNVSSVRIQVIVEFWFFNKSKQFYDLSLLIAKTLLFSAHILLGMP